MERCGPALARRVYQENGPALRKDIRVLLYSRDIAFLKGLATKLQDGDHLSLIPPLAGG
ncbi:MAG: MoaD/ThiS family protein [Bacillota bacterium]